MPKSIKLGTPWKGMTEFLNLKKVFDDAHSQKVWEAEKLKFEAAQENRKYAMAYGGLEPDLKSGQVVSTQDLANIGWRGMTVPEGYIKGPKGTLKADTGGVAEDREGRLSKSAKDVSWARYVNALKNTGAWVPDPYGGGAGTWNRTVLDKVGPQLGKKFQLEYNPEDFGFFPEGQKKGWNIGAGLKGAWNAIRSTSANPNLRRAPAQNPVDQEAFTAEELADASGTGYQTDMEEQPSPVEIQETYKDAIAGDEAARQKILGWAQKGYVKLQ